MRRIPVVVLTVGLLALGLSVVQQRSSAPALAVKAAKVECFGFHAAQTEDVAEVNVFNDSSKKATVSISFFRASGQQFGLEIFDELEPREVNDYSRTFALGGDNGPIQRAVIRVKKGPETVAVDGSVHLNVSQANESMRSVTCQKG